MGDLCKSESIVVLLTETGVLFGKPSDSSVKTNLPHSVLQKRHGLRTDLVIHRVQQAIQLLG